MRKLDINDCLVVSGGIGKLKASNCNAGEVCQCTDGDGATLSCKTFSSFTDCDIATGCNDYCLDISGATHYICCEDCDISSAKSIKAGFGAVALSLLGFMVLR